MERDVRYCTTDDGVEIAYSITGGGPPLVRVVGWFTHLEYEWETPFWRAFIEQFSRQYTLIRYDGRGTGLSQRDIDAVSAEGFLKDLEAVVNATGFSRVILYGLSQGGPTAILCALDHPDRVSHLVLYGSFARNPIAEDQRLVMQTVTRAGWGSDVPAHRQFFTGLFMPDGPSAEDIRTFNELQRLSATPEIAASFMALPGGPLEEAVFQRLPELALPTLVIHRRGDTIVPFERGRELAARIPGARLVALDGRNHVPLASESDIWERITEAVDEFTGVGVSRRTDGGFRTILFTDIVGHTGMMSRLGDERGRDVLREHERITREVLKAHGGTEVKTMGDGFMASFASVTKGVKCAIALQCAFHEANENRESPLARAAGEGPGVRVRIGLNAGEPIEEEGDLFGATVILAARIAASADGAEILASDVVRQLCAGKGFLFADRGEHVLRGFEDPVRIFDISWRDDA